MMFPMKEKALFTSTNGCNEYWFFVKVKILYSHSLDFLMVNKSVIHNHNLTLGNIFNHIQQFLGNL